MPMLYLLRHGAIETPEAGCFIGQLDVALSEEGRRQAVAWQGVLADVSFSAVWASDLTRTRETADIVFEGSGIAVQASGDLREIRLGKWEGVPRRRLREESPGLWHARGRNLAGFKPPGGESFQDLQERVIRKVERIARETGGNVCVVTHAGVIRVLICHFLAMELNHLFRIRVDYAALSIVACSPERIEVCALNLRPSTFCCPAGGEIGG
jgi:probable phosphoglycerate mutase